MDVRMKQVSLAVFGALSSLAVGIAAAQTPQKIEKIEVTGSNIKRVDTETVAPVQVITRDEIQKSGKSTVAELLRDLPINTGNSFNETFTNSFSPGASGISLRGLGQKNTLTLINGRRMANYGFAQNLQDTYVDVNSIPASAVDRIEILKSGASHIYGSDAIAGVVNIILRKDYRGIELGGSYGTSTEGGLDEKKVNLGVGFGDLGKDRFNVLASLDYFERELLLGTDREFTKGRDFRRFPGGTLARGTSSAYIVAGTTGPANGRAPFPNCRGELTNASLLNPILSGTSCTYDLAPYDTLFPETKRLGAIARGTFEFTPTLSAFAEFGYSKNETFQTFSPAFITTNNTAFNPATGGVSIFAGRLPVTSPYAYRDAQGNPLSTLFIYTFLENGGRNSEIDSESTRFLGGFKGTLGTWDWEVGALAARNEVESFQPNRANRFTLQRILADNSYNYFDPTRTPNVSEQIRIDVTRKSKSTLEAFDAKASTELAQLPAGPLGFAAGVETRREKIQDRPDAQLLSGAVSGQGATATDGSRRNTAVFGEFNVPIIKSLEGQLAVRHERYSDFGNETVPGAGLKFTPTKELLFRTSYSEGFRAPTLPENSKSSATFFQTVTDPRNNRRAFQIAGVFESNPDLKPEKSKSYNFGVVVEPSKDTNMSIDWFKIKQRNVVAANSTQFIINNEALFPGQVVRDENGFPVSITSRYINQALVQVEGFDFDLNHTFNLGPNGKLKLGTGWAYIHSYKETAGAGSTPDECVDSNLCGAGAIPRYRNSINAEWERGPWVLRLTRNYIHSWDQTGGAVGSSDRVGQWTSWDLFAKWSGVKNLDVTLSVRNLDDRQPPFDSSFGLGYDFTQHDLRGRYVTVGATYKFR